MTQNIVSLLTNIFPAQLLAADRSGNGEKCSDGHLPVSAPTDSSPRSHRQPLSHSVGHETKRRECGKGSWRRRELDGVGGG